MSDIVFCPPNVECPCYARLVDEVKRLREANELMLTDIRRTDVDMLAFKARIAQLEAALKDARVSVEGWADYASDYIKEKWDLKGDLARIDAALGEDRT